MSFFSSPAVKPAQQEPTTDPAIKAQRDAIEAENRAAAEQTADKARRRFEGRTMGTAGANALFTAGPGGYGRTMGQANI